QAYNPDILRDPVVSITIAAQRQSTFSILGAVAQPGTYNIVRKDMRLLETLALAGGVTQTNIRYLYVIRPTKAKRKAVKPEAAVPQPTELPPLPQLPPEAAPTTQPVDDEDAALRELGKAMPGPTPTTLPAPSVLPRLSETASTAATTSEKEVPEPPKAYKWVYANGRWIRVLQEAPRAKAPSGEGTAPVRPAGKPLVKRIAGVGKEKSDPFGWKKADKSDLARIIAINLPKLRNGDPRMNIVVRDNDIIQVPTLEVGEFYVMGEVLRPGVYSLTGRRVTVKMAVAAAGNLGPLAWPENSILVRRIGDNQEQVIPLDIEAIFQGEEPDVFLKPDDVIAVGTDVRTSFYAVVRNAFRMTYGFGFIYDRNFAEGYDWLQPMDSKRFTRW
ncbi:MAG: SLBB domain-containing protein, partial [Planctomycetota bacterium]|nr:SLBB domain-containing protein [Planctomycetota bacterium]